MSFFLFIIGLYLLYEYDGKIYGNRRCQEFLEKVELFERNGLGMHLSKNKGKQMALYKDKQLEIQINKKRDKIEFKVFFCNLLSDKQLIHHMIYDIPSQEMVKDVVHKDSLADYWGNNLERQLDFLRLKPLLLQQANQWFDIAIPMDNIIAPIETPVADANEAEPSPLAELVQLLSQGKFHWNEQNNVEHYGTSEEHFSIQIEKNAKENHRVTISRNEDYLVRFEYNPIDKKIAGMDIRKTLLHTMKKPKEFVSTVEKVLFICYEKTHQKQMELENIIEHFNQKPYVFLEKEKELRRKLEFLEDNCSLLNIEERHLFNIIKNEKMPEIMAFKENMISDHSIENDLVKMITILNDVVDKLHDSITKEQSLTFQMKERLVKKMKYDK